MLLPLLLIGASLARKPRKDKDEAPEPAPAAPESLAPDAPDEVPPEKRRITDVSAFTVPDRDWRVGAFTQEYGLFDNAQIGTSLLLFPLGFPNASAKITAIEERRLSVSIQGAYYFYNLATREDIPNGRAALTPVGFTTTWATKGRLSFHSGYTWQLINVRGEFTPTQIGNALVKLLGTDIGDELSEELEKQIKKQLKESDKITNVHGEVALSQLRLGMEWRRTERATWIAYYQVGVLLHAMITGSIENKSTQEETGLGVFQNQPIKDDIPAALVIARQWSWDHYNLRVGLPLWFVGNDTSQLLALPYAVNMYWQF